MSDIKGSEIGLQYIGKWQVGQYNLDMMCKRIEMLPQFMKFGKIYKGRSSSMIPITLKKPLSLEEIYDMLDDNIFIRNLFYIRHKYGGAKELICFTRLSIGTMSVFHAKAYNGGKTDKIFLTSYSTVWNMGTDLMEVLQYILSLDIEIYKAQDINKIKQIIF